jgi:hypothetical protein
VSPAAVGNQALQAQLENYDRELSAQIFMLDTQVENREEAERLKLLLTDLYGQRRVALVEQFAREETEVIDETIDSLDAQITQLEREILLLKGDNVGGEKAEDNIRQQNLANLLRDFDIELEARRQHIIDTISDEEARQAALLEIDQKGAIARNLILEKFAEQEIDRLAAKAESAAEFIRRLEQEIAQIEGQNQIARAELQGPDEARAAQLEVRLAAFDAEVAAQAAAIDEELGLTKEGEDAKERLYEVSAQRRLLLQKQLNQELRDERRKALADLDAEISELDDEVTRLTAASISGAQGRRAQLDIQLAANQAALAAQEETARKTIKNEEELTAKLLELRTVYANLAAALTQQLDQAEIDAGQRFIDQIQQQIRQLRTEAISDTGGAQAALDLTLALFDQEVEAKAAAIRQEVTDVEEAERQITELRAAAATVRSLLIEKERRESQEAQDAFNKGLDDKIAATQNQIAALQAAQQGAGAVRRAELEATLAGYAEELEAQELQIDKTIKNVQEAEALKLQLRADAAERARLLTEQANREDLEAGREFIASLRGRIAELRGEAAEAVGGRRAALDRTIAIFNAEVEAQAVAIDQEVTDVADAEAQKTQLREQAAILRNLLIEQSQRDQVEAEKQFFDTIQKTRVDLEAEIRKLESEAGGTDTRAARETALNLQLEAIDRQLVAQKLAIDENVEDVEEAERLKLELTELFTRRAALVREQFARQEARLAIERIAEIAALQEALATSADAAVGNTLDDQLAQERATFKIARDARRRAFAAQIKDLKLSRDELLRLQAEFNRREVALELTHQRELADIREQLIGDAFANFERRQTAILKEQQEQRKEELELQEDLLDPTERRIQLLEAETRQVKELETAQKKQLETLKKEIALLKARNEELGKTLTQGSKVLAFLETANALFGVSDERANRERLDFLERERAALLRQLQVATQANVPLEQRIAIINRLRDANEEIIALGGEALDPVDAGVVVGEGILSSARNDVNGYINSLAGLGAEYGRNIAQIEALELEQENLNTLLEATQANFGGIEGNLKRLRGSSTEPVFIDPGLFGGQFVKSLATAVDELEDLGPQLSGNVARAMTAMLEEGDVQGAVDEFMRQTGREIPEGLLRGILLSPPPSGTTFADSLAQSLGVRNLDEAVADLLNKSLPTPEELAFDKQVALYQQTLNAAFLSLDFGLPPGVLLDASKRLADSFASGDLLGGLQQFALATGQAIPEEILRGILAAPSPTDVGKTLAESLGLANATDIDSQIEQIATDYGKTLISSIDDGVTGEEADFSQSIKGEEIIDKASSVGHDAGTALADQFILGLNDAWPNVVAQFGSLIEELAEFLPASDAKRGALSNLHYRGQAMMKTFMAGVGTTSRMVERSMANIMRSAVPPTPKVDLVKPNLRRLQAVSGRAMPGPSVRNVTSTTTHGPVNVYVGGEKSDVAAGLSLSARDLVDAAQHEIKMRRLTGRR